MAAHKGFSQGCYASVRSAIFAAMLLIFLDLALVGGTFALFFFLNLFKAVESRVFKTGKMPEHPGNREFSPGKKTGNGKNTRKNREKTNKFILYIQTIKNLFKPGLVEIGANCLHCSSLPSYFMRTIRQKN